MEHSSIGTLFSQNKSLRQRIDSLQSMGYSPEEAIYKAKLGITSQPKIKSRLVGLPRLRSTQVPRDDTSLADFRVDKSHNDLSEYSYTPPLLQRTTEACTSAVFKITNPRILKSEPDDFRMIMIKVISNGCGTAACSLALIYFGSKAGNFTPESCFWSILFVLASTSLLAVRFNRRSWKCWCEKILGFLLVIIGYLVMHTSIDSKTQLTIADTVAASPAVLQIQASIKDLELRLSPTRNAIAQMDPIENRPLIAKMQRESKTLEEELARKRDRLVEIQSKEKGEAANLISDWGFIDWLRRLTLEPLNILCLHGLIESLPKLVKALRQRSSRLANAAV
jgi:hypothetical protein